MVPEFRHPWPVGRLDHDLTETVQEQWSGTRTWLHRQIATTFTFRFTIYAAGRRNSPISWIRVEVLANVSDIVHHLLVYFCHNGFASGRIFRMGSVRIGPLKGCRKNRHKKIVSAQNVIQGHCNTLSSKSYSVHYNTLSPKSYSVHYNTLSSKSYSVHYNTLSSKSYSVHYNTLL